MLTTQNKVCFSVSLKNWSWSALAFIVSWDGEPYPGHQFPLLLVVQNLGALVLFVNLGIEKSLSWEILSTKADTTQ